MSVPTDAVTEQVFVGAGTASALSIGFKFLDADDLVVTAIVAGVEAPAPLVRGVDYAVAGGNGRTGTVTPLAPIPVGTSWRVRRETPVGQPATLPSGTFQPSQIERALDRQAMVAQEQDRELGRALRVPRGQLPPGVDFSDLVDGDLLQYRGGVIRRFLSEVFAGKYYAGAAGTGRPVPATPPVAGSDAALRADLAEPDGASLVAFKQPGADANIESIETAVGREVWADQFKLVVDAHDGPCITRAVSALLAAGGGGVVRLSRRSYTLNSPITFTALNNVRIVGAGSSSSGTMLREAFTSGDAITFSNCQHCELRDVDFWPTVRKTSGYSVKLTGGSFACRVDIRSDFGWNGLLIDGATETRWRLVSRYMLGTVGALFTGTEGSRSFRAICEDQISDNPFPVASPLALSGNKKTFTGGMSLALGDHFVANDAIWQCTQAGTAGASAPSGYPAGTSPESVFTTDIDNGTAKVRFVCHDALTHIIHDSWAYSLVLGYAALLNGARGFAMEDSADTGTSYPVWTFALNLECDNNYFVGCDLAHGEGFFGAGINWIGSCKTGNGLLIGPDHRGNVVFGEGTRCMGNAQHGGLRQAGPVDVRFDGAEFADNSAEASGVYHGLRIAPEAVDTHITGGRYGDSVAVSGNAQGYGISIGIDCEKTSIIGALVRGNTTGPIDVGSGQVDLMIEACPGYNNEASASEVSVGASPWTYTNASGAKQNMIVTGGTVSSIALGSDQIASATGQQVLVPIGGTVTITYSALPTVKVQRL